MVAQARAVDMLVETSSSRLWLEARAVSLVPSEVSLRIAGARGRVLSGRRGCFVEPRHGIESSKWAILVSRTGDAG
ncbi:hypothetical protein Lal_00045106 [Lupinus albus]|nr:hypothetical protein Lal_00045106 [Lupinus albus]